MKKLVMLLLVLSFCLPASGELLLYKICFKVKPLNFTMGEYESGKGYAYAIVEVDAAGDYTGKAALVIYGMDYWGNKVQETYDSASNPVPVFQYIELSAKKEVWGASLDVGSTESIVTGTASMTSIGAANKVYVAKKMYGYMLIDGTLPILNQNCFGCGTVDARFMTSETVTANKAGKTLTDKIAETEAYLTSKGYQ